MSSRKTDISTAPHAATADASRNAAASAVGVHRPPLGNTGGNSPTHVLDESSVRYDSRAVCCHWLRVTHPAGAKHRLRETLVNLFGPADAQRGRWFYEHGERFGNGVMLLWGTIVGRSEHDDADDDVGDSTCCVDVPGSAIDAMEPYQRLGFFREMTAGGRVSRVDLAVDAWHREGVGLIDAVLRACVDGCLCGARKWSPQYKYDGADLMGYGVNIGARGNEGSGRYVRVYDKGLESKEHAAGRWERYEVEFSGDAAAEVAADVFGPGDDWEARAWARITGAVSYRHDDSSNGELARRKMCAWWLSWIGGVPPVATVVRRVATTLDRHRRWLIEIVLPTAARLASEIRVSFTDALVALVGTDIKPRATDKYMKSMLAEWRRACEPLRLAAA